MKPNLKNQFPKLTDDLLPGLRQVRPWTVSLDSWLQSVKPSEARALLSNKESFLREIDRLAWAVMRFLEGTKCTADDYAEALKQEGPNWEDSATEEEIEKEQASPLTKAEIQTFEDWATEAEDEAKRLLPEPKE